MTRRRTTPKNIPGQFARVPHAAVTSLSRLAAIGLLAYLEHLPPTGTFSARDLERKYREGRQVITAALAELEALGYVERCRHQGPDGRWHTTMTHTVTPSPRQKPTAGNQHTHPSNRVNNRPSVLRLVNEQEEPIQEEQPTSLPCPRCNGHQEQDCRRCHGSGQVAIP